MGGVEVTLGGGVGGGSEGCWGGLGEGCPVAEGGEGRGDCELKTVVYESSGHKIMMKECCVLLAFLYF